MKILMVNTFHYRRGGDSTYVFQLSDLLGSRRHQVVHFAMAHTRNNPSVFSEYFVPEIDFVKELESKSLLSMVRVAARSLYSHGAQMKIRELLRRYPVDIAHVHNIRGHISTSIFKVLRGQGVPIVWTLHDFALLCPNTSFVVNGRICEACKGGKYYNAFLKRCRKSSYRASFVVALEEYANRMLRLPPLVDYFIAPSRFLRQKFIEYGFSARKVVHLPNFMPRIDENDGRPGDYAVYLGRISAEKGLKTLLKAWAGIKDIKLLLVGDGPLKPELENQYGGLRQVEILGHLECPDRVRRILRGARFAILPSECYENAPYAILESYSVGRPVIGSDLAGIPEMVKDGVTGLLFKPGDAADLAAKIRWLAGHETECAAMGSRAKDLIREEYSPSTHYDKLMELYSMAASERR